MSTIAFDEGLGPLMSRKEAARYLSERGLQTAPQTLARKFCEGTGPLCATLNRRAMYYRQHLGDWFAEQLAPRSIRELLSASWLWLGDTSRRRAS